MPCHFRPERPITLNVALAALLGLALAAVPVSAHEYYTGNFVLVHPWADPTAPGAQDASVYFHLEGVAAADVLESADSPLADHVDLVAPGADSAPAVTALPVPAGERIDFKPGGAHLVLRGLHQPLLLGREYQLRVNFARAGSVLVGISVGAH